MNCEPVSTGGGTACRRSGLSRAERHANEGQSRGGPPTLIVRQALCLDWVWMAQALSSARSSHDEAKRTAQGDLLSAGGGRLVDCEAVPGVDAAAADAVPGAQILNGYAVAARDGRESVATTDAIDHL
jgi:hypothetical protein